MGLSEITINMKHLIAYGSHYVFTSTGCGHWLCGLLCYFESDNRRTPVDGEFYEHSSYVGPTLYAWYMPCVRTHYDCYLLYDSGSTSDKFKR